MVTPSSASNLLVVLLGPTASGKTEWALQLAESFGGEIIGADSRQVYRGLDIGSAKPTPTQQARAPHHLIDVAAPDESFSLSDFLRLARVAVEDVMSRGRLPLLVGGTGQYITALTEGWDAPAVPPNPALRAELESVVAEHGVDALYARLIAADPEAAAFVDPRNPRRIIRALEVMDTTGEPFSAQRRKSPPPWRIITFGLTVERDVLYQRADRRLDAMMDAGFLDEVRGLLAGGYGRALPSMSALGYSQLCAHLLDGVPLSDALEQTRFATHDFIRRQYTWFRGHDRGIRWLNTDEAAGSLYEEVAQAWSKRGRE